MMLDVHPSDRLASYVQGRNYGDRVQAAALVEWLTDDPNGRWVAARLVDLVLHLQREGRLAQPHPQRHDLSPALVEALEEARARSERGGPDAWRGHAVAELFLTRD